MSRYVEEIGCKVFDDNKILFIQSQIGFIKNNLYHIKIKQPGLPWEVREFLGQTYWCFYGSLDGHFIAIWDKDIRDQFVILYMDLLA